MYNNNIYKILG